MPAIAHRIRTAQDSTSITLILVTAPPPTMSTFTTTTNHLSHQGYAPQPLIDLALLSSLMVKRGREKEEKEMREGQGKV
jgi:hypothetical protein